MVGWGSNKSLPKWHGWHAFRRGLATNLHQLGVADKDIQAILRHSNIGIPLRLLHQAFGMPFCPLCFAGSQFGGTAAAGVPCKYLYRSRPQVDKGSAKNLSGDHVRMAARTPNDVRLLDCSAAVAGKNDKTMSAALARCCGKLLEVLE
jgi:hypothetical protein